MKYPWMAKWSVCAAAAALAACTGPAETNVAAEANAVADANGASALDPVANAVASNVAGNAAAANSASTGKTAAEPAAAPESYSALGQEPGWALKIGGGRIDYSGNYGEKKINVERPEPAAIPNGRRYTTPRLTVTITYARCNDAMSGFGFEHQVTIVADGETYQGCGGARKKAWDM